MATLEELTAAAQTAIDAKKTANGGDGMWAQVNDERREFTDADYDQAVTDKANSDFDLQENVYITARQQAYKSIPEQLDMIYKAIDADSDLKTKFSDFHTAIKSVKDNNPKPE